MTTATRTRKPKLPLWQRDVLTSGMVAKVCNVAPRTVTAWFDSGRLRGYRIPDSKDRRIPRAEVIRFCRANGMPVSPDILPAVLFVGGRSIPVDGTQQYIAANAFQAGMVAAAVPPLVVVVDANHVGTSGAATLGRDLGRLATRPALVVIVTEDAVTQPWPDFDVVMVPPAPDADLAAVVRRLLETPA